MSKGSKIALGVVGALLLLVLIKLLHPTRHDLPPFVSQSNCIATCD